MSKHLKRLLSLLLALVMIVGLLPTVSFAAASKSDGGKSKEKKNSDEIWATINRIEDEKIVAKRGKSATADDYAAIVDDVIAAVEASDSYVEGTIERHGDFFFWETEDGEPQGYSPRLRAQMRATANPDATAEDFEGKTETVSYATRGGSPSSKNVAVFQPYYGIDSSFTTQYKEEGESIAAATGGTCNTYLTTNATITQIGAALSNCAVVIFDSHGDTDYYVSGSEDYVTQANTSYLCLQTSSGWTSADKAQATGTYGKYYHAYNAGSNTEDGKTMYYYCFDGTAMANHMSGSCNNLLWMAICLGMATTGLHQPLRNAGVGVVYGYSQSVTFTGDYAYEADFWNKMKAGNDVKTAFAYMTRTKKWDSYSQYNTIGKARYNFAAFPNVVSAEDTYQGHRTVNPSSASDSSASSTTYNANYGACNVQTVNSTWTLFSNYTVTATATGGHGTVSVSGNTITCTPATGYYVSAANVTSGTATTSISGNTVTVDASSDCTVNVVFSQKTQVTMTYYANGSVYNTATVYSGDEMNLPASAATVSGWTFAGWSASTISDTTTKPSYYAPGAAYTPTANTTLYAVYSKTEGGSGETTYEKATSIAAGDKVVFVCEGATAEMTSVDSIGQYTSYSGSPAGTMVFDVLAGNSTGTFAFKNGDNYLGYTGSGNNLYCNATSLADATSWNVSFISGDATITNAATSGRQIWWNVSSPRFACYTGKSAGAQYYIIQLYKQVSAGTTTYTTSPFTCTHTSLTAHAAVSASCTTAGNSAYWSCNTCGALFSNSTATTQTTLDAVTIAALGHSYGAWVSDNNGHHSKTCATCSDVVTEDCSFTTSTSGATVTHTCSVCSYSYNTTLQTYTVTYNDHGTTTTDSCVEGNTVTLPATASTIDGYTFAGWVASAISTETATAPTLLSGTYEPAGNVTLYACYFRSETGGDTGVTGYVLASGDINSGDKLIVALKSGDDYYALPNANKSSSASISGTSLTVTNNIATDNDEITFIVSGKNGYTGLKSTEADYYLGLNGSGKIACNGWGDTKYLAFTEVGSGLYTITSTSYEGRGLITDGTSFKSAEGSASNVYIFRYTDGAAATTLYYTTSPVSASTCEHESLTAHAAVSATCTTAGNSAYWECDACHTLFSDSAHTTSTTLEATTIAALGHNLVAGTPVAATCTAGGYTPYTCSRAGCGVTENRDATAALGHSWGAWTVIEPTASADGSRTHTCTRCAASESETISNAPVVTGYNLTTNGDVLVNSYISIPQYMMTDDSGMYVTIDDGEHILLSSITTTPDANGYVKTSSGFKFPYAVPAKNMQDTVTLRLYQGDGTQVVIDGSDASGGVTYSVQGYINQVLADAATYEAAYTGLTALCKAMSAYGSYAQVQQNYTTPAPVSVDSATAKEINAISTASISGAATASTTTNNIDGLNFYGASLVMLGEMTLRFYFTYSGSATLTSGGNALATKGDYYYVDVTGIAAKDFSEGQTVTVSDGTHTCTVSGYSVNRYVYKILTSSGVDASMLNLAKAIAYYGIKADAYHSANS